MQFEAPLQGSVSVERMCQLGQVSRAGFYRYLQTRAPIEEGMTVRSAIQEIALQHRLHYGYRRITVELRQRGMNVNHKWVARMMQNDNLLTIGHSELPWTTDRRDEVEIYLNLASRLKVGGPNQVWIGDVTYIRLKAEFVYLAVVIDCLLSKSGGLGARSNFAGEASPQRSQTSDFKQAAVSRTCSPFGSRCAVYLRGLHPDASGTPDNA